MSTQHSTSTLPKFAASLPAELGHIQKHIVAPLSPDLSTLHDVPQRMILARFPREKAKGVAQYVQRVLSEIELMPVDVSRAIHRACEDLIKQNQSVQKNCRNFQFIVHFVNTAILNGMVKPEEGRNLRNVIEPCREEAGFAYLKYPVPKDCTRDPIPPDWKDRLTVISVKDLRALGKPFPIFLKPERKQTSNDLSNNPEQVTNENYFDLEKENFGSFKDPAMRRFDEAISTWTRIEYASFAVGVVSGLGYIATIEMPTLSSKCSHVVGVALCSLALSWFRTSMLRRQETRHFYETRDDDD